MLGYQAAVTLSIFFHNGKMKRVYSPPCSPTWPLPYLCWSARSLSSSTSCSSSTRLLPLSPCLRLPTSDTSPPPLRIGRLTRSTNQQRPIRFPVFHLSSRRHSDMWICRIEISTIFRYTHINDFFHSDIFFKVRLEEGLVVESGRVCSDGNGP